MSHQLATSLDPLGLKLRLTKELLSTSTNLSSTTSPKCKGVCDSIDSNYSPTFSSFIIVVSFESQDLTFKGGAPESDTVSDISWTVVKQKKKGAAAARAPLESTNSSQAMGSPAKGSNAVVMRATSGVTEIRFVRGKGQNADVKISAGAAIRTQVQRTTFAPSNPSSGSTAKISFPFDPISYNFIDEITKKMSDKNRKLFMKEKWFELAVDQDSIEARLTAFPSPNIFDQMAKLGRSFDNEVQHVVIYLIAPTRPLRSTTSTIARAYPFLARLVDKLRDFTSLKNLDIVVELDKPLDLACLSPKAFDCVLPFYELETFTDWRLKWSAPGVFPPRLVGDNFIEMLTRRSEKYRKMDEDAFDNMVVIHESEEKDLDPEELKKWGKVLVRR
ncbi:hypothetical protein BDZ45DRAFT_749780 [Acephala macrosclerotiorum]|nr:hypothetical protein BDZ45DRAFT_749780 [Acephala macrosclerotiorum]